MNDSSSFFVALDDLAVLSASGADAISFLHGQLTQDIQGLPAAQARLAGFCSAKGRLLASMIAWKQDPRNGEPVFRALVKADVAQALAKRLSMFVLRAKATIQVTTAPVYGLALGADGEQFIERTGLPAAWREDLLARGEPLAMRYSGGAVCLAAASASHRARWWIIPDQDAQIPEPSTDHALQNQSSWQAEDIVAGLPWVQQDIQDVFIPQTLNFDLIDGVSFTKGCYPGQEVVARAHYRGTVKRRMVLGVIQTAEGIDPAVLAGSDTYDAQRPDSPCGRVVNAAANQDSVLLLMEAQLADIGKADFRLGSAQGPSIKVGELPYPVATPA